MNPYKTGITTSFSATSSKPNFDTNDSSLWPFKTKEKKLYTTMRAIDIISTNCLLESDFILKGESEENIEKAVKSIQKLRRDFQNFGFEGSKFKTHTY